MMERIILIFLLSCFQSRVEVSSSENLPKFLPSHEAYATQPQIFYPYSDTICLCSIHREYSFLQCEERFLVSIRKESLTPLSIEQKLEMACSKALTHSDLNHNYPRLIGLNRSEPSVLLLEDCPEPSFSFARQFFPPEMAVDVDEDIENNVTELHIKCDQRKYFSIIKTHLRGLSSLLTFNVSCSALKSLPWNVFQGTTPSLQYITIVDTQIAVIPSRLFYNLSELRNVHLMNNYIKEIKDDAFLGCASLLDVRFNRNELSVVDENVLGTLENITTIDFSGNKFAVMPRSFKKLSNLENLNLSHNLLERLNKEHCDGLSNIEILNVSYNFITHIHENCFGRGLSKLDISGNALENVTEDPIRLNRLRAVYFRDNNTPQLVAKKYFTSTWLSNVYMSNSNVFSIDKQFLHGFPMLEFVDLSANEITSIPEDTFVKNEMVRVIQLQGNNISSLPPGLFRMNEKVIHLDLSRNAISELPKYLFSQNSFLQTLNFSFNLIESVPEGFLANITSLNSLNFSNNHISSLQDDAFANMRGLDQLDLSHNDLFRAQMFSPPNTRLNIRRLFLQGNKISQFPDMTLEKLEHLDMSRNELKVNVEPKGYVEWNLIAPSLKELYLSHNQLEYLPLITEYNNIKGLETLDLSHNKLRHHFFYLLSIILPSLPDVALIKSIDLSNNYLEIFDFEWLSFSLSLERLNLSYNYINHIPMKNNDGKIFSNLRVLDLCNNNLTMKNSPNHFNKSFLSWGPESPFQRFPNLEFIDGGYVNLCVFDNDFQELHLRNNSISSIFLDWRIEMPRLKYLDLRHNNLPFLSHQDLIFKSTADENIGFGPYHWQHKLVVDMRNNQIRFVELPHRMLRDLPKRNETRGAYGNVEMLIDDNPFECGCALFNLLRVIRYDAVLTSQLRRVTGERGMYPAKLEVGNLSCRVPETVKGKKLNYTEEWIHHLVPLFGICNLQDIF